MWYVQFDNTKYIVKAPKTQPLAQLPNGFAYMPNSDFKRIGDKPDTCYDYLDSTPDYCYYAFIVNKKGNFKGIGVMGIDYQKYGDLFINLYYQVWMR